MGYVLLFCRPITHLLQLVALGARGLVGQDEDILSLITTCRKPRLTPHIRHSILASQELNDLPAVDPLLAGGSDLVASEPMGIGDAGRCSADSSKWLGLIICTFSLALCYLCTSRKASARPSKRQICFQYRPGETVNRLRSVFGLGWFFEWPGGRRPLNSTWPWADVKPSILVLWGVCWMFNPLDPACPPCHRCCPHHRSSRLSAQHPTDDCRVGAMFGKCLPLP